MNEIETRLFEVSGDFEVRVTPSDKGTMIGGYAARFQSKSKDLGGFVEIIAPGAFSISLNSGADVRCLIDHDPSKLLSRTSNKTLRVWEDEKGLRFESLVPNTTYGKDLLELMKLQTVAACSFGFRTPEGGDVITRDGDTIIRTLKQVELREVSIVATPAYDTTSVSIRIDPSVTQRIKASEARPELAKRWHQYRRAIVG